MVETAGYQSQRAGQTRSWSDGLGFRGVNGDWKEEEAKEDGQEGNESRQEKIWNVKEC